MFLTVVFAVVMVVVAVSGNDTDRLDLSKRQDLFTPLRENCTNNLVELLLLRQEMLLTHILDTVRATRSDAAAGLDNVTQMLAQLVKQQVPEQDQSEQCLAPYSQVGDMCLLLAISEKLTWAASRQYCAGRGGDLVTFPDANTYALVLNFIHSVNADDAEVAVWVGGSDEEVEGSWLWITGELMPRGPPFWGTVDGYRPQPLDDRSQNCAILWHPDQYYMHDAPCTHAAAPLCQNTYQH